MKKKYKTPLIIGLVIVSLVAIFFLVPIVQQTAVTFASADTLYFGNSNPATFKIHITDSTGFDKLEVSISSYDTQASRECSGNVYKNSLMSTCMYEASSIAGMGKCCRQYGWRDIAYGDASGCGCFRTPDYTPSWVRLLYKGQEIGRMNGLQIGTKFDLSKQINEACASQIALWVRTRQGDGTDCDVAFQFENDNGKGSMGLSLGSIANKEIAFTPEPTVTPEPEIPTPEPEIMPSPEPEIIIPPESQKPIPTPSPIQPPIDDSKPSFFEIYKNYFYILLGISSILVVYALLFYKGKK